MSTAPLPPRCEPPPELRGEPGWHWLVLEGTMFEPKLWLGNDWDRDPDDWMRLRDPTADGWRYHAPCVPPPEPWQPPQAMTPDVGAMLDRVEQNAGVRLIHERWNAATQRFVEAP